MRRLIVLGAASLVVVTSQTAEAAQQPTVTARSHGDVARAERGNECESGGCTERGYPRSHGRIRIHPRGAVRLELSAPAEALSVRIVRADGLAGREGRSFAATAVDTTGARWVVRLPARLGRARRLQVEASSGNVTSLFRVSVVRHAHCTAQ